MNPRLSSKPDDFLDRMNYVMQTEKRYQDSELELSNLSRAMGVSKRKISEQIRVHYGTSFPDFVNDLRLQDVLFRFAKQDHKKHTILAIASEAGFPSKSTFYRYFKKKMHLSPSEFLRKARTQ